jgi:Domain of unknown function (DUF222)
MCFSDTVSFGDEALVDALFLPPGAELAAGLESLIPFAMDDGELVDALKGFRRLASWAQAGELEVIAELGRRRPAGAYERLANGSSSVGEFLVDEVEVALTLTGGSAAYLVELALTLSQRLPGTLEALRAGLIDVAKVKVIAQGTAATSDEVAARVESQVLAGAVTQTTSQLRSRVARAVIAADPGAAERRRKAAEAQRDVHCHEERDGSGTATISGRRLPADQAVAAANRLNAIARGIKAAGDTRRLGAIRADVLLAMMLGLLPADLPSPAWPEGCSGSGGGAGDLVPEASGAPVVSGEEPPQGPGHDTGQPPAQGADQTASRSPRCGKTATSGSDRSGGFGGFDSGGSGGADGVGAEGVGSGLFGSGGSGDVGADGVGSGGSGGADGVGAEGVGSGGSGGVGADGVAADGVGDDLSAVSATGGEIPRSGLPASGESGQDLSGGLGGRCGGESSTGGESTDAPGGVFGSVTPGPCDRTDGTAVKRADTSDPPDRDVPSFQDRDDDRFRRDPCHDPGPPDEDELGEGAGPGPRPWYETVEQDLADDPYEQGDDLPARREAQIAARAGARVGTVNLTIPLTTYLGLTQTPADIPGYGPLLAEVARILAHNANRPGTAWCITVLDDQGRPIQHGETRYRPGAALRRKIEARYPVCVFPECRRPARACDLDHTVPYGHDRGITCGCNIAPLCRRHHRAKQANGWRLDQIGPGHYLWTTPSGKRHHVSPEEQPR